ncbi:hypothetical protein NQZ68_032490 [Dissostichus eleginoides]|nr:hypothetical protein NQZ68_032490 [Dissostichus eleginoides]
MRHKTQMVTAAPASPSTDSDHTACPIDSDHSAIDSDHSAIDSDRTVPATPSSVTQAFTETSEPEDVSEYINAEESTVYLADPARNSAEQAVRQCCQQIPMAKEVMEVFPKTPTMAFGTTKKEMAHQRKVLAMEIMTASVPSTTEEETLFLTLTPSDGALWRKQATTCTN